MNKEKQLKKYLEESTADKIWKDYFEGRFSCDTIMLSSIVSTRKENERLQQENKQLKDNWNKLKEKIKEIDNFQRELKGIPNTRMTYYDAILEMMQELEKGEENEKPL